MVFFRIVITPLSYSYMTPIAIAQLYLYEPYSYKNPIAIRLLKLYEPYSYMYICVLPLYKITLQLSTDYPQSYPQHNSLKLLTTSF